MVATSFLGIALVSIGTMSAAAAATVTVGLVAVVTIANLRGIKESGRAFAVPTYVYIFAIS